MKRGVGPIGCIHTDTRRVPAPAAFSRTGGAFPNRLCERIISATGCPVGTLENSACLSRRGIQE